MLHQYDKHRDRPDYIGPFTRNGWLLAVGAIAVIGGAIAGAVPFGHEMLVPFMDGRTPGEVPLTMDGVANQVAANEALLQPMFPLA